MSRLPLRIRTIANDEFEQLEAIENDADRLLIETLRPTRWAPAPPGDMRRGHAGVILVAECAHRQRGEIQGFIDVRTIDGTTAYIDVLAVRRQSMRAGIGRRLLREAVGATRNAGLEYLTLRTYRSIAFNGPFYASEGFRPFTPPSDAQWATKVLAEERKAGLPRPDDREFMRLPLDSARYGGPTHR